MDRWAGKGAPQAAHSLVTLSSGVLGYPLCPLRTSAASAVAPAGTSTGSGPPQIPTTQRRSFAPRSAGENSLIRECRLAKYRATSAGVGGRLAAGAHCRSPVRCALALRHQRHSFLSRVRRFERGELLQMHVGDFAQPILPAQAGLEPRSGWPGSRRTKVGPASLKSR